ncbi:MAG: stress response translation initiation inhibitor YciH [Candidatus Omnitrophota bacterium]|jgi:translation initiation factor 1
MQNTGSNIRLIYSSAHGPVCPDCAQSIDTCACRKIKRTTVPKTDGAVRLRYETKGRKGKGMTIISGLPLSEEGLLELVKKLKQRLGTGGSVKGYAIELQGDHREPIGQELRKRGYEVK